MRQSIFIGFALLFFLACQKEQQTPIPIALASSLVVPTGFPMPTFPVDNKFTEARFALGKKLFYEVGLSRDSSVSCASCHAPHRAFSDTVVFSPGAGSAAGVRNSPTLANVAYHPYYTREGGVPTLEMQVLVPIQEHNEFDFNILLIAERLITDPVYNQLSWAAYDRPLDFYAITRGIACYERALISGQSAFDQFFYGGKQAALSPSEKRGMDIFFSEKTNCTTCHSDFNFTNYSFENNGLYEVYPDVGRYRLTEDSLDIARFKVPTLRNVALTGPYMHDGSINSLEKVVEHYNSGGKNHPHKSTFIRPLGLSVTERADLVTFLQSLTDKNFISNVNFK